MSRLLQGLANRLWYLSTLPASRAFHRAAKCAAGAQQQLLLDLVSRNAATEFGRRHGFAAIRSVDDFRRQVPLSEYDDYTEAVAQISAGRRAVLTVDPVQLLERTSGSAAASKLIPYTAGLKAEFQRAIGPWIADLFRSDPALMNGQAYWSISPVARRGERTSGGTPVGFEEDQEYLGGLQRHLSRAVMAVPPQVRLLPDMAAFRYVTLLFLLRSQTLSLISVWNPTFLTLLLRPLAGWSERLIRDIAQGTLSLPDGTACDADVREQLFALNRPDPGRAAAIHAAFLAGGGAGAIHSRIWPDLRLISCWTEAHAAPYVTEVEALFPQARVQGKGLIATEGFISFPLTGEPGAVLAIRSHFFEFLPEGGGEPVLAHQVEPGQIYSVVITTGGGLYRYRLHDLIEVVGKCGQAPLIRFLGKEAHLSDWFGEKVNERHVRRALAQILAGRPGSPLFSMVACEAWADGHAYTLFLQAPDWPDDALKAAGAELEVALQENFHYQYCRDLGQLAPVKVFRVTDGGPETYLQVCQALGQRAGDVKPVALHRSGGWRDLFKGHPVG